MGLKHTGDTLQTYISDITNSVLYTEDIMAFCSAIYNDKKFLSIGETIPIVTEPQKKSSLRQYIRSFQ